MQDILLRVEDKVKELLAGEATGHDWYHIKQVRDMALRIAETEGGNLPLIELAALAHDIGDRKFFGSEEEGEAVTRKVLVECGVPPEMLEKVMDIVHRVSFKGAGSIDDMQTLEGKIVQDADRLYALGAIGIARTFAYGGSKGRPIYDPSIAPNLHKTKDSYYASTSPTINHFYEKLLLLKDRMHTATGKKIAQERHAFMEEFLKRFMAEWDAKD